MTTGSDVWDFDARTHAMQKLKRSVFLKWMNIPGRDKLCLLDQICKSIHNTLEPPKTHLSPSLMQKDERQLKIELAC